ncbi:MAG TPA: hypothetical protein VEI82_12385 [Myxococcota bacterium]|nr:hypothetical protein [Myxococcota bacterium]
MGEAPAAPARIHGSLVEVAGVGVLLLGRSGIGKSECALELVMRGHRLVADDVVLLGSDAEGRPLGWSPELVRHYLELRGIGIVHVPSLFGERAVLDQVRVELVVQLAAWGVGEVERVGLEQPKETLEGFEIAVIRLPVAPGRNIASLVEVAARNHLLRSQGKSGAADLDERVIALLRGGAR